MSLQGMSQVMDRYTSDATFRDQLRSDPQGTIRASGIQLDEQEMEAVQSIDWTLPDQELKQRVSKWNLCFTGLTLITMADGTSRPISHIRTGDLVLGGSGRVNRVIGIHTPLLGKRPLYAFNSGEAFVTSGHPFMTESGWKSIDPEATATTNPGLRVGRLAIGDRLLSLAGVAVPVGGPSTSGETVDVRIEASAVQSLEGSPADPETQLYNLHLDGNETYFANGLLVHNK